MYNYNYVNLKFLDGTVKNPLLAIFWPLLDPISPTWPVFGTVDPAAFLSLSRSSRAAELTKSFKASSSSMAWESLSTHQGLGGDVRWGFVFPEV